jgi:hypothetical protein
MVLTARDRIVAGFSLENAGKLAASSAGPAGNSREPEKSWENMGYDLTT